MDSELICVVEDGERLTGAIARPRNFRDESLLWPVEVVNLRADGELPLDPEYELLEASVRMTLRSRALEVDLPALRAAICDQVKAERDRRQSEGGVLVAGMWWKSSDTEINRYTAIIASAARAGVPGSYVLRPAWRSMEDGKTHDMSADFAGSILLAGLQQFAAIDDRAQALIAEVNASDDPAGVDITTGWPKSFGEPDA